MAIDYTRRGPAQPDPAGAPAASTPAPAVSLSKITLTKAAPSVSLTKDAAGTGLLKVNLDWKSPPPAKGFLAKLTTRRVDLDLACLYEFTDGTKGVVQALGNSFEAGDSSSSQRIVWLDGDDRSGAVQGGENLTIDLSRSASIRRILVFAMIYEGVSNWAAADGVVTLTPPSGAQIEVRLDESDAQSRLCAIAEITNGPSGLQVRREVKYIRGGHKALDEAYGWGLSWTPGRK